MKNELLTRHVAGVTAILSGVAQVSWAVLNRVTQGGLDSGGASPLPEPKMHKMVSTMGLFRSRINSIDEFA